MVRYSQRVVLAASVEASVGLRSLFSSSFNRLCLSLSLALLLLLVYSDGIEFAVVIHWGNYGRILESISWYDSIRKEK